MTTNRRLILQRRPQGMPVPADFALDSVTLPPVRAGEILVRNDVLSVDPAIRGWLDDRESYVAPLQLGDPIRAMTLGRVVGSGDPDYPVGTVVRAVAAWEEYSLLANAWGLQKVEVAPGTPLEHYMGPLGPAGLTAWVGLFVIASLKPGDTVLVSAAGGAVGNVACQLALRHGCHVVALAGDDAKLAALAALGVQQTLNYRKIADMATALRSAAPDGFDVYFDNVGAATLEAALPAMKLFGRVAVCGAVAEYNSQDTPYGVKTLWQLVVKRLLLRGFITFDHPEHLAAAQADLEAAVREGKLQPWVNLRDGLESTPQAFIDMLAGRTQGKTLVRLP